MSEKWMTTQQVWATSVICPKGLPRQGPEGALGDPWGPKGAFGAPKGSLGRPKEPLWGPPGDPGGPQGAPKSVAMGAALWEFDFLEKCEGAPLGPKSDAMGANNFEFLPKNSIFESLPAT